MKNLKQTAQELNGPKSLKVAIDESTTVLIRDQKPKQLVRHVHAGKAIGRCEGNSCKLCAAGLPTKSDYLVLAHEKIVDENGVVEWQPRTIWCTAVQLDELTKALPDEPAAVLICTGTAEQSKDGNTYCKRSWSLAANQSQAD